MRRIAALSVFAASALLLAACGKAAEEAPGGYDASPPADAPATPPATDPAAPFKVDFSASGTEPFWRVDVKGTAITLSGPAAETVSATTATDANLEATDGAATWTGQAGTTSVSVKVTKGECSDGMSDLKYPYTAVVMWGGTELKGCGFPTAEQPREGQ